MLAFGFAGALAVAGVVCAALVAGSTGEILATALLSVGLVGVVVLVFLEVGLSEDRERAGEEERRRRSVGQSADPGSQRRFPRRPRRPD